MGGQNETVATQKKDVGAAAPPQVTGKVRYHTSGGEVHFHDDANQLKVAVPVATWFAAWQKLESGAEERWRFVDRSRKTLLEVGIIATPSADGNSVVLDACLSIRSVPAITHSEDFTKLKDFTTASK